MIVLLGALSTSSLNAASNILNQICDLEIDRINKPDRLLPSGIISIKTAGQYAIICYFVSLILAALVNIYFLMIVVFTAVVTAAYSVPPIRLKRFFLLSNLIIAFPRGCLLMVAGWTSTYFPSGYVWSGIESMMEPEPWFLGGVLGLFILGAATTKDFADIEGDMKHGCRTLPVVLGAKKSVVMISPFLVFPFLLLPLVYLLPEQTILTGNRTVLSLLGCILCIWGIVTSISLFRNPSELAGDGNHPAWWNMYLMLITAQIGYAAAYFTG